MKDEDVFLTLGVTPQGRREHQRELSARAEEGVQTFVKAKGWTLPPDLSHLAEILHGVNDAMWSETVRDMIGEAMLIVGVGYSEGTGVSDESRVAVAPVKGLPSIIKKANRPLPIQVHAVKALTDVAAFITNLKLPPPVLQILDRTAKLMARENGENVTDYRANLASSLGCESGALDRARKREGMRRGKLPQLPPVKKAR